jgi:hypothetical protein
MIRINGWFPGRWSLRSFWNAGAGRGDHLRRNFGPAAPGHGIELTIYRNRYEVLDLSLMGLRYRQPARESAPKPWTGSI